MKVLFSEKICMSIRKFNLLREKMFPLIISYTTLQILSIIEPGLISVIDQDFFGI